MVPFERELIDRNQLDLKQIKWINNYHKKVFNNIKDFMLKNEIQELEKACSII